MIRISNSRYLMFMLAGIALFFGLAGCAATNGGRIQARIDEKPDVFAKLTKQQQKDIKWGYVRAGYTPEMVYFAFGKPDQIVASADKGSYVWIFIDRTVVNDDVATASAMRNAGTNGGAIAKTWGTHDDNFPPPPVKTQLFPGEDPRSSNQVYPAVDAMSNLPTIWVAFKDNVVLTVQRFGDTHDKTSKTGSLGG